MADVASSSPRGRSWAGGVRARLQQQRFVSANALLGGSFRRRPPADRRPTLCPSDAVAPESPVGLGQASRPRSPLVAAGSIAAEQGAPRNGCESPSPVASRSPSLPATISGEERRVQIRISRVSTQSVVPYSEVYGRHPSFFDFDRRGGMVQTDAGVADELRQQES